MTGDGRKGDAQTDADSGGVATDPLTAILPAMAALGCICSIAAVLWAGQEPTGEKIKPRRKPTVAVRDLETDCLVLQETFRRLARNLRASARDKAGASLPLKFGLHQLDIAPDSLIADIARVLPSVSQNAHDVMRAVENGAIDVPESVFYGLGECQEKLTRLLSERASVKTIIEAGLEMTERVTGYVQTMKRSVRDPA
jgi:hypothetical protein